MRPHRTARRYLQCDVFADRPGAGNALGVVFDAGDMDAAAMQALAAWLNLSETIFFLPPDPGADYRIRIFTPRQELPFAGHPSVGAAWVAVAHRLALPREGRLVQQCGAGLLPVRVASADDRFHVSVRSPRASRIPVTAAASLALIDAALHGLPRGRQPPALWNNGPAWWIAELADAVAVRAMTPDLSAIAALTRSCDMVGLAVYGRSDAPDHQLVVRAYCPADNIPEDPVTGSANACIAAQLAQAGTLPGADGRYIASQGRELGRDGKVQVQVDDEGEVWIGGEVQQVIDGRLDW